jgi:class 3 adenylate cyclase
MQITDPALLAYIRHRLGEQRIESMEPRVYRKALELNTPAPDLAATFGKSTLTAYVGFIDLAGFSTAMQGRLPEEIVEYIEPFLSRLIGILRGRGALIDKTIGDEVMFVLPEKDEDLGCEILFLGQLMGGLHDLAFEFKGAYPFRIGLSYGKVRFFCVDGLCYSEWTTVGQPVHIAKRLQMLQELRNPRPVIGAFGMEVSTQSREEVEQLMKLRLSQFAGFASRFDHRLALEPVDLKGVGKVLYATLLPRPERITDNDI